MTITRTHTKTRTWTKFADPYKVCNECGGWIDGAFDGPGPLTVVPCEHRKGYKSVCPSWGPVDGCSCIEFDGYRPHRERPSRQPVEAPS